MNDNRQEWKHPNNLIAFVERLEVAYLPVKEAAVTSASRIGQAGFQESISILEQAEKRFWLLFPVGQFRELIHAARGTVDLLELPIDMILHCPTCFRQHIDAPDERTPDWTNPPHKTHLCHGCGCKWRPANVPTNGVRSL